jgi:hypothetical protein
MTRVSLAALALLLLAGGGATALARLRGTGSPRASLLLSVLAQWLGAYVLWTFAGGLLHAAGVIGRYDPTLFGLLALALGVWQYRVRRHAGRDAAALVFLGGQLAWLLVVLVQNGFFTR